MTTQTLHIPLDQLKYGHDAIPPINARRTGRQDDIGSMAASLGAHGQIHALSVKQLNGDWYVVDGNRRLAAMHQRADAGELALDVPVRCEELVVTIEAAKELSLAANIERLDLHPADQYEAFHELAGNGLTKEDIANRFGIEPRRVARMLALGRLSPLILNAWREGAFVNNATECVRAFTLASSIDEQERVFHNLTKDNSVYPHSIRREFGAGDQAIRSNMKTVGIDAYVAAGGEVVQDLFGDDHIISDPELAQRLAMDKLLADRQALLDEGWLWADFSSELPGDWSYNWRKLQTDEFTSEHKAMSGCVVTRNHNGEVNVIYGVVRPEKAKVDPDAGPVEKKQAIISAALAMRLSVQATHALRKSIMQEPRIGLVALLAGFIANNYHSSPVRVKHEGMGHGWERGEETFQTAFERLMKCDDDALMVAAAGIASEALQLGVTTPFAHDYGTLADAMDRAQTYSALREKFDVEDYFKSVSKDFCLQAIRETLGEDEARRASDLKKPELTAFAITNVPPTGWLPAELRTDGYPGPGSEQP